jgi:hypothetical protein
MTYRTKIEILAEQILLKLPAVRAWQRKFLCHLFVLWLSIRGRHNFANLARQGNYVAYTIRKHFDRPFDFLQFNKQLADKCMSPHRIIAFDPSYMPKSGKCTDGVGYFWSGCAGREKRGLEISGISVVDLADKTALHLEAIQTVFKDENETLLDYYGDILQARSQKLLSISKYLVADAYFSRNPFVNRMVSTGFHVVSRLKKNTYMRYLYTGPKLKRRGAPKKYDGQVKPLELRQDIFTPCAKADNGSWVAYEAVVHIRSWKRRVKVVIVHDLDKQGNVKSFRIYASTDLELDGGEVIHMYQCRFQQEFLFRDAKQEAGLEHCQAYSWERIYFHINTALSAVSLAKVAHHLDQPIEQRGAFSIADIRTRYTNENQTKRIFSICGFDLQQAKIKNLWEKINNFGKRAA